MRHGVQALANAATQSRLEPIPSPDGCAIPTRIWEPVGGAGEATPVVMLHGLQSHSGWFERSQAFLAGLGLPVYAFDRRGSGVSTEPRGDCGDYRTMIDDVHAVADRARKDYGSDRVHVFGHCFGAMPATAFACAHPARTRSLILATPGLFTKSDLRLTEKLRVLAALATRREVRLPIPLEPEMFSELPEHVKFIQEDDLSLHDATASFFFQVLRIRRFFARERGKLSMPVLMTCAGRDEICDNARNRAFFESIPCQTKRFIEYPRVKHILEMSLQKDEFFVDLEEWLRGAGRA